MVVLLALRRSVEMISGAFVMHLLMTMMMWTVTAMKTNMTALFNNGETVAVLRQTKAQSGAKVKATDQRLICVICSTVVVPGLPITSRSGSFL